MGAPKKSINLKKNMHSKPEFHAEHSGAIVFELFDREHALFLVHFQSVSVMIFNDKMDYGLKWESC